MKTIHLRNLNNLGDKFAFTADVMEGSEVVASYSDTARSLVELEATLTNLKERTITTEKVQADFATLTEGEYIFPTPELVIISAEEVFRQEQSQKEQQLREAVDKAEWNKKVTELALTNADVATKLEALTSKVIAK